MGNCPCCFSAGGRIRSIARSSETNITIECLSCGGLKRVSAVHACPCLEAFFELLSNPEKVPAICYIVKSECLGSDFLRCGDFEDSTCRKQAYMDDLLERGELRISIDDRVLVCTT